MPSLMVDRRQGPLYKQLVAVLRAEILKGVHSVGQNLPTESELCARFDVSRPTVREALRELRTAGLVESRRGSGTTVVSPPRSQSYVHEAGSIADLSQYAATRWEIVSNEMVAVDGDIATRLRSQPGERWLRIEANRYGEHGGSPVYWTRVYLHPDYAGIARLVGRRSNPLYELVEDMYGERIGEVEQIVHAREVPDDIAGHLGIPNKSTVIEVMRTYQLTTGKLVELSFNLYPAQNFSLALKLRRTDP